MDLLRSQNFEEIYGEAEIKRQIEIENELRATFQKEKEISKEAEQEPEAKNEEEKEKDEGNSNLERILSSQNSSNQNQQTDFLTRQSSIRTARNTDYILVWFD